MALPKAPLVLLIEDNRTNRMLTSVVLKRSGFEYEAAGSAEEAREILEDMTPDLILMDLQLPGMDGLTFTRELKKQAKYVRLPIVALTARAMRGDELMTIEAGCDGYVAKPLDVRTFPTFLREVLARNQGQTPTVVTA